ncbi:MAG: M23 family metallopeptidase [Pyrinomonadaceae bacterium]
MKPAKVFRLPISLISIIVFLASCGNLAPKEQNENLPVEQNTNLRIVSPTPNLTAVPTATIEETPTAAPPFDGNVTENVNSAAHSPVNVNVNSSNNPASATMLTMDKLIIPVAGIKREDLRDAFSDARSEGRVHDAIDIMAAQGTPVLAAADGEIARFFDSERGGITIYQFSRDKKLMYYYAHLQKRADDIQEHQYVRQGTVIGYVGDTGNAGAGNYHLHFAIWIINDPQRYWDGTNINPYPLLR